MIIPEGNLQSNVDRFSGFADLYDKNRPEAPEFIVDLLCGYLERKPALVMDLGCGTGLSTLIWRDRAERVIGVEPNDDMRSRAESKLGSDPEKESVSFVRGFSNPLDAADASVDIMTCSQSFHWMEPVSTLKEAHRVLKPGGIFAVYDCDWPPVLNWRLEEEYLRLTGKADELASQTADEENRAVKRDKDKHLNELKKSGAFRFTREIVFHNRERCDAGRFIGLALSQGGLQTALKRGIKELDGDIEAFRRHAEHFFAGETKEVVFSYRLRLGIK